MTELHHTQCCGVGELSGISYDKPQPRTVLCQTANRILDSRVGLVTFTGVIPKQPKKRFVTATDYGRVLARYIEDQKLGSVRRSHVFINPNTKHRIVHFAWAVDRGRLKAWLTKQRKTNSTAGAHG